MPNPAHKRPMLACCQACTHLWPLIWLPMDAPTAAKIMKASAFGCPACGNTKASKITMASQAQESAWHARHSSMAKEVCWADSPAQQQGNAAPTAETDPLKAAFHEPVITPHMHVPIEEV